MAGILLVMNTLVAAAATDNVLGIPDGDATTVGIYVKNLSTGRVMASYNASMAMTPASVTKAVTTASALLALGPDFRFTTTVSLQGSRGSDGVWNGNLVINSCGDPTIGSDEFETKSALTDSILGALKRAGIRTVTGRIVIKQTMKDAGACPTWECEDIAWSYGAGLFGFNYAGNTVGVFPVKGTTTPPSTLKIRLIPSGGDSNDQIRGIDSNVLTVSGTARSRANRQWRVSASNPDPAYTYTRVLESRMADSGIKLGGDEVAAGNESTLCVYRSPEAAEICRNLMKRSDNMFAEGMLRAIDPEGTRDDCIDAVKDIWKERGLTVSSTIMHDGSGLTRSNRFSPLFLAGMLEYMAKSPLAETYTACFPVAGIDGTMRGFGAKSALKGRLAMKTGSLSSVQTYAGYRLDADGRPTHVVVVMVNGFFCPRPALRDAIVKYLLKVFEKEK